jgi:heterodisulfide reductase subunit D
VKTLGEIVAETKAYYCLECGVCTGSCPISRFDPTYSPRLMVERALLLPEVDTIEDSHVWSCLTCGTCSSRCPSAIEYRSFTRSVRDVARERGLEGVCTHAGTIQAMMELQTMNLFEKDTSWIGDDLKVSKTGEYYYFIGCLPQYEAIFREQEFDGKDQARSAIKLLNRLGVEPVVSSEEKCCGHDFYWSGQLEGFTRLAKHNLELIRKSKAKKVVFSCPEGYSLFKQIYPELFGKLKFEVLHITELIAERIGEGGIEFSENAAKVTYQDPCRLGRFSGLYEQPREILKAIPGVELLEMPRNRKDALCCGSSTWVNCSRVNKKIQLERLKEAIKTGAEKLITACPKCKIHLSCALKDNDLDQKIEIKDLDVLLAESLGGGEVA